jgi:hypothetical protein
MPIERLTALYCIVFRYNLYSDPKHRSISRGLMRHALHRTGSMHCILVKDNSTPSLKLYLLTYPILGF